MSSPERLVGSPENNLEAIGEAAKNRSEELRGMEYGPESGQESAERQAEKARIEALESAVSVESGGIERGKGEPKTPAPRTRSSKSGREANFKRTMDDVQHELNVPSRTFSKVIHNRAVEVASEGIGKTIARPSAIISGALIALVATFALYLIAKFYGYPLSGFETIGAFIIGWILGLTYDFAKIIFTGKK